MNFLHKLDSINENLWGKIKGRLRKTRTATLFVKVGLIAIGSAFVAVAQFASFEKSGPTVWQLIGILASLVVAIGAVFVVLTEEDVTEEMQAAKQAIDVAREISEDSEAFFESQKTAEMAVNLYISMAFMRGVLERAVVNNFVGEDTIAQMMEVCSRTLPISMAFEQPDLWTICIYKAITASGGPAELKCIAHERAIKCDLTEARSWIEGVGVAGIAYANAREVIVPDLQAHEIGSMFNIGERARSYDSARYRSIATAPIIVDKMSKPWGVVVATSDKPYHFYPDSGEGFKSSEAVRALAGMVALVVAVQK